MLLEPSFCETKEVRRSDWNEKVFTFFREWMEEQSLIATPYFRVMYNKSMATYSFDVVSEYDKAEMNNVFAQSQKEMIGRYDFKNTPAEIDWLGDKTGFKVIGANDWQIDSIIDIIRKKLASRDLSSKVLDLSKTMTTSNLKATKEIPFIAGLDQEKAKQITKMIRDNLPKLKTQIQGEAVRVTGSSKDELQSAMQLIRGADLDFPVSFNNFR